MIVNIVFAFLVTWPGSVVHPEMANELRHFPTRAACELAWTQEMTRVKTVNRSIGRPFAAVTTCHETIIR